ncbi:MAG: type IV secretion protein Rhs [Leptolyngbya sp.]|nr:MAG: type IV secretion protein Rhs [Leptolyngbya sp.]
MPPQPTYTAEPHLEIEGKAASDKLMGDILQISIEESLHLPSMFTIVFNNPAFPGREEQQSEAFPERKDRQTWEHEKLLSIGKSIRIGFTNSVTESPEFQDEKTDWILWGEITAIETHFTSGSQAPMIIRGYDRSHRLNRGCHNRSFQKMSDTEILKKIIKEVGIEEGTVDNSSIIHDYVFQENQTNLEFLRERAARNGFELFMQDGKLHFRQPKKDGSLEMTWQQNLTSFQVRVTSAEQVNEVEVRGWDYKQKRAIVANRSNEKILTETDYGKGQKTSSAFQGKPNSPKLIVVDQPVETQKEADNIAQALFNEMCDQFVHADAQAQGHPSIRPGRVVTLKGMGKYSGKYYITETHHTFSERLYKTAFSVRGLRGGDLLTLLSPSTQLHPGQTLLIGKVTNIEDPDGLGRVRVKFPTLTEDHESHWARVVAIGAGKGRGFDCLPEIDDEVLVGFEHGDIHRPFIIGGLWNGSDSPPEKVGDAVGGGKVRLRTIKTRTGHQLQFVEESKGSSQAGVIIKTAGGHEVVINDSDRSITLSSTGNLNIKAIGNIDINANGMITVQGVLIKLN